MSSRTYARVKEVFTAAVALDRGEWQAYLDAECAEEPEIRREVEELLANHGPDTVLDLPERKRRERTASPRPPAHFVHAGSHATTLGLTLRRHRQMTLGAVVAFLVMLVVGVVLFRTVEASLERTIDHGLTSLVGRITDGVESWVRARKIFAPLWARDDDLRRSAQELVDLRRARSSKTAGPMEDLLGELEVITQDPRNAQCLVIDSVEGVVLASAPPRPELQGLTVSAAGLELLQEAADGTIVRIAHRWKELFDPWPGSATVPPSLAIILPLYAPQVDAKEAEQNPAIRPMAMLIASFPLDGPVDGPGDDPLDDRFAWHFGPFDDGVAAEVLVVDRTGRLLLGDDPSKPYRFPPFAKRIHAGGQENDISNPDEYRGRHGTMVIGAWQWLENLNLGVAVEVDRATVLAPLMSIRIIFSLLLGGLLILGGIAFFSAKRAEFLARRVGEGEQLGQYTLLEMIGEGGLGKVYQARHAMLRRPTAVKLLKSEVVSPETVQRFEREVQRTAELTHPNTIAVYDYGISETGTFYYAMEYLDGITLSKLIKRDGAIGVGRTIYLLRQVLRSLEEAHDVGLIHRDIKPLNIMLNRRSGRYDVVKVLDFGLVKEIEPTTEGELTLDGMIGGTSLYIAPERFLSEGRPDGRSDLYSVGTLAYLMLTDTEPFLGVSSIDVCMEVLNAPVPRVSRTGVPVPAALDELIFSCMAKNPEERPASAAHLADALDELQHEHPWPQEEASRWWRKAASDIVTGTVSLCLLVGGLGLVGCGGEAEKNGAGGAERTASETGGGPSGFVDSKVCEECHEGEYRMWVGSHHDRAMEPANEETVLGDFDDAEFEHFGVTTRLFRRDGKFMVNTEGPDGELTDYEITYTFGVHPLQQYLIEFPGGRKQCLGVAWDNVEKTWFHLYPNERIEPDDELHWTGRYQNWNMMCAECHSTALQTNYDPETDTYDTTWEEIDVGCQACHGSGERHVLLARSWNSEFRPEGADHGLSVILRRDQTPREQIEVCAPCHSRRQPQTRFHQIGESFWDAYRLQTLGAGLYHADGQILEEVYVFGSFVQSKMYAKGVTCSDCHDPHSIKPWFQGDALCLQCHTEDAPLERFETLTAKQYDTPEHHFHPQESESARCVACHMPMKKYMVVDPRHDHSLRIPRPDLTLTAGTPNVCNDCHTDQDAQWSVDALRKWYGTEEPPPHYANALSLAREGSPEAFLPLMAVIANDELPAIARATALEQITFTIFGPMAAELAMAALEDPDPLVRAAALGALEGLPEQGLVPLVAPYLEDPARLVRTTAARALVGRPESMLDKKTRPHFEAAMAEFFESQRANADMPSSHLNLGVVHAARGDRSKAEAAYRRALSMDRDFLPAVFNLTNLLSTTGRNQQAEKLLVDAAVRFPEEGELHYSLGLLRAEEGRLPDAAESLRLAAKYMPYRPRVHYNLGLAMQQLGRIVDAEAALLRAAEIDERTPDYAYALSTFYLGIDRLDRAFEWAEKLIELVPEAPGPVELRDEIQKRRVEAGR